MIEIYPNIREDLRQAAIFTFDVALRQKNHMAAAKTLMNFLETCETEEEREYVSLVFYTKLTERLENESNIN